MIRTHSGQLASSISLPSDDHPQNLTKTPPKFCPPKFLLSPPSDDHPPQITKTPPNPSPHPSSTSSAALSSTVPTTLDGSFHSSFLSTHLLCLLRRPGSNWAQVAGEGMLMRAPRHCAALCTAHHRAPRHHRADTPRPPWVS